MNHYFINIEECKYVEIKGFTITQHLNLYITVDLNNDTSLDQFMDILKDRLHLVDDDEHVHCLIIHTPLPPLSKKSYVKEG